MATSITHEDIKPIIGIPTATTTYDTEFDTVCTAVGSAVDAYCDTGAPAAVLKQGAIYISAGECMNYLSSLPGRSEAISAGGVSLTESIQSPIGDKLISLGWELLKPFGLIDYDAVSAEAALRVALAQARDDHAVLIATAEKDKAVNEAALLASQELKVDAETANIVADTAKLTAEELRIDAESARLAAETARLGSEKLKVDAEVLTEAEAPAKVQADAAMSTAYAADANARAAMSTQKLTDLQAFNTALADETNLPMSSTSDVDLTFNPSSSEYL